ncbi:MAG: tripartite tricarboxylate transporter substrate binding protein [Burkholderiales bacterium]|nr:tripartite tricarboxylate transporter substrate binding protein [Burkholderiales bacterium]
MNLRRLIPAHFLAVTLLLGTGSAFGQSRAAGADEGAFPSRPVRVIVPFAAGGGFDRIARLMSQDLSDQLKQTVIIENRDGAGGIMGISAGARSAPDGYTVVGVANSFLVNPLVRKDMPYRQSDLTPVALIGSTPSLLVIRPSLPVKTLDELIRYGNSGKQLSYGSYGAATTPHLAAEALRKVKPFDATHVPYRGEAAALNDLLAGNIDMMFGTVPLMLPHVTTGRLRAIAVGTSKRAVAAPEYPTVQETFHLNNFHFDSWYGIMAPSGVDPARLDVLKKAFAAVLAKPSIRKALLESGLEPAESGYDFGGFLTKTAAAYKEIIESTKITVSQ